MRDPPDAAALLALAEAARDDERDAALVRRCRAIAAREARFGRAPYAAFAAELAVLLAGAGAPAASLPRLAAEIRAGRFDAAGPERARVERLLWALTVQKLRESNPDFLAGTGLT